MTTNYRNTREIVEFASTVIAGDEFTDIESGTTSKDSVAEIVRSGAEPISERFASRAEHDRALLTRIRQIDCPIGDIGVLSPTNQGVRDTLRLLESAGIPAINLADYAGISIAAIKVGTVKRAKGLEFKQVLMPRVSPRWLDASAAREDEALAIHRRELYVAMTRARDGLWVGVCS
jgi:superfamily I DNA/RNA helicase